MRKWEIYLAEVPFEDMPKSKTRPVLILEDSALFIDCLKMTSQPPRSGEYVLKKWAEAGLDKQTVVRVQKRLVLPPEAFIKRIGVLSAIDMIELEKLITT